MSDDELEHLAHEYAQVKAEMEALDERKRELQTRLVAVFRHRQRRRVQLDYGDESYATATLVEPSRVQVDEQRLKRALGAPTFTKVSTPRLDRDKLDQAIKTGDVDANVVAECSYDTGSPYIKVKFTDRGDENE